MKLGLESGGEMGEGRGGLDLEIQIGSRICEHGTAGCNLWMSAC